MFRHGGRSIDQPDTAKMRATNAILLSSDWDRFAVDCSVVVKSHAELVLLIALLVLAALSVLATLK